MRLFLFTRDVHLAGSAQCAGVYSAIVDWERLHKYERQRDHAFEINEDGFEDASRLAAVLEMPVTVRVNQLGPYTADEVERALALGARVLMLPMASRPAEVEAFLRIVAGRAETLVQIETQALVDACRALRELEWDYVHIGLNDLSLSRANAWLWEPLLDGTVEHICATLEGRNVGFGGATIIGGGAPIPFVHILREMVRLQCGMAILRRTFKADILNRDMAAELDALRAFEQAARARTPAAVAADHAQFMKLLAGARPALPSDRRSAGGMFVPALDASGTR